MVTLKRLTSPFREFGIVSGLLYVIHRALVEWDSRFRLFSYELMAQPIPVARAI